MAVPRDRFKYPGSSQSSICTSISGFSAQFRRMGLFSFSKACIHKSACHRAQWNAYQPKQSSKFHPVAKAKPPWKARRVVCCTLGSCTVRVTHQRHASRHSGELIMWLDPHNRLWRLRGYRVVRLIVVSFWLPGQKNTGGLLRILPEKSPFPHWKLTVSPPQVFFVSPRTCNIHAQCLYFISLSSQCSSHVGCPGKEGNSPDINICS